MSKTQEFLTAALMMLPNSLYDVRHVKPKEGDHDSIDRLRSIEETLRILIEQADAAAGEQQSR